MRNGAGNLERCGSTLSCLGASSLSDDSDCAVKEDSLYGRSYSYFKLPPHYMKISILKLDGSVFDVHVKGNATVLELKEAIEDIFESSPDGQCEISWSNVWGHFCLCFHKEKLLNDRAYLRSLGIRDGDQLRFVHHLSIDYSPVKRPRRNQSFGYGQNHLLSLSSTSKSEDTQENSQEYADSEDRENQFNYFNHEENEISDSEFSLASFMRRSLLYSRLGENDT